MIALDVDGADAAARHQTWAQAVRAVLAKQGHEVEGDPRAVLDRLTVEGVRVPSLADPADYDRGLPGAFPFVRGATVGDGVGGWDVRSLLTYADPRAAAAAALDELAAGSTSLWLTVGGDGVSSGSLGDVLAEVLLDLAPVVVQADGSVHGVQAALALADVLAERDVQAHGLTNLGLDPSGAALRGVAPTTAAELTQVARRAVDLGIRGLVADATAASDLGGGDAAEVAMAIASGVETLRQLEDAGVGIREALSLLEFRLSVTDDQFVSIAKLRAARLLWAGVALECGAEQDDAAMRIHAVTARAMMTRYDPWTNLLRTTVAAFSAGVGGAESVTVLPFDVALGHPSPLGTRMARNISSLLVDESHVAATADPAGGSYAVEQLTDALADAAWSELQRIESAGGLRKALADGSLRGRLDETAATRRAQLRDGQRTVTGVTSFPLEGEQLLQREPWGQEQPPSWAGELERERDLEGQDS